MPFIHETLFWWGLPLLGVPILIHLINMMRHRRVKWAAMEFLLASQKRHRTWIILKQLLLLLLRIAAVAAIVLMVAQPLLRNNLGAMLGNTKTHHVILLDDSYSMSDSGGGTSAFEEAKQVIARLAAQLGHQDSPQTISLMRFSRVAGGDQPDLLEKPIDSEFPALLEATLGPIRVSETAAGPADALAALDHLPGNPEAEERVLYLVSDFRAKEWNEPTELRKTLSRLDEARVQLHLVSCVDGQRSNLSISGLKPGLGTRAAGVPLLMDVTVRNYGTSPVKEVSVQLEEDGVARPAVVFELIPPGKAVSRRFSVLFTTAGEHTVTARLQSDAVEADNARVDVVKLPDVAPVLIVDGDPKAQDAQFVSTALAPGGKINSGLKPVIESPRALRKGQLSQYETIFLLNVERFDPAEVEALEAYVRGGGGACFFLGELVRNDFYTQQLYRGGEGIFPLPLGPPTELLVDREDQVPDFEVTDHPIFSIFAGERNSFISSVIIQRYFTAAKNWAPDPESSTKVIAKLRNGAPLAVEHALGDGRVIAFLTKAGPGETLLGSWNNWGRNNPSYVVALLEMQAYLAAGRHTDDSRLVGTPLVVDFPASQYNTQVRFVTPDEQVAGVSMHATPPKNGPAGELAATLANTGASGVYEAQLTPLDGSVEARRYAFNVVPEEGDLKLLESEQLASRLSGVRYQYHQAKDLTYDSQQLAGFNLGEKLLYLLLAILIGEQILAYALSYHRKSGGARP